MMSLSRHTSDKMRGQSIAIVAPLWEKILSFKSFSFSSSPSSSLTQLSPEEEKQRLQLENQLLEIEISYLQEQLQEQQVITAQMIQIASFIPEEAITLMNEYQKSLKNNFKTMKQRIHAVPGRVIFRSFDTWNSFLWINIGESTNQQYSQSIIAKNSPVVVGKAIIGVIDYVGNQQSRIRLITDHQLNPSVRSARGGEQDLLMNEQIERLLHQIRYQKNLPISLEEQTQLSKNLLQLKQNLQPFKKTAYLAKGKLLGSPFSSRLGQKVFLKGMGFNYDFSDEEGECRDLRTGKSNQHTQGAGTPILKVNDLLITTGMDGIFPKGFQVAIVTRIGLLKEGDYFYDLEARPAAGSLEELSLVFVLPPMTTESYESK